jgi:hypothetical protein
MRSTGWASPERDTLAHLTAHWLFCPEPRSLSWPSNRRWTAALSKYRELTAQTNLGIT